MEYLQQAYISNLNVVCGEGGFFRLQQGQQWQLDNGADVMNKFYYITRGNCRIVMEGESFLAEAGDWFFIPAETTHSYTNLPGEPLEKYWIHFDLYPNASLPQLLRLPLMVRGNGETSQLFEALTKANTASSLADRLHAKILLMRLLAQYLELSDRNDLPVATEENRRINEVLSYIHQNLSQDLTNRVLAQQCHMHPNHFIRFFAQKTGQTPASYVVQCRMDMARQLLTQTELPVSQVAEQVGIPEQSHFARLFRRYCSLTPTQYRKRHQN